MKRLLTDFLSEFLASAYDLLYDCAVALVLMIDDAVFGVCLVAAQLFVDLRLYLAELVVDIIL